MAGYALRSAGVWLHTLGPVGDIEWTKDQRGLNVVSWSMALPVGYVHPALTTRAVVELHHGAHLIGHGGARGAGPHRVAVHR